MIGRGIEEEGMEATELFRRAGGTRARARARRSETGSDGDPSPRALLTALRFRPSNAATAGWVVLNMGKKWMKGVGEAKAKGVTNVINRRCTARSTVS